MSANSPHSVFNCTVGGPSTGPQLGSGQLGGGGDTFLFCLGANLTPGSAASALTLWMSDGATVILTLGAPASGGTVNGVFPSLVAIIPNAGVTKVVYTLSGTGASAQIYFQSG